MSPTANDTGNALEVVTYWLLRCYGYRFQRGFEIGVRDEMGKSITVDFYVHEARLFPAGFYIECKWQMSSGSADEKLYGVAQKIKELYNRRTIVVADGSEMVAGREYLLSKCGGNLVHVFTVAEFMEFIAKLDTCRRPHLLLGGYDPSQPTLFTM